MALAVLSDVVKRYDGKLIVDHVNFNIQEGEIFGLLGPNGAGKSTTISMICGLLQADSGDIIIDGLSVRERPLEVKKRIGLVPQELALYENMTASDNVSFFGRLYGLRGQLLKERTQEALEFTGLSDRARDKPSTFSGGMKRRLNIACAIMHRPRLIIMDEPTVGIDPQSRNHILESVKALNKMGSSVIYTSHYMEEVAAICDRVAIMDQGHIIACGTENEPARTGGPRGENCCEGSGHHPCLSERAGAASPDQPGRSGAGCDRAVSSLLAKCAPGYSVYFLQARRGHCLPEY